MSPAAQNFWRRVGKSLGLLSGTAAVPADPLVKINLPPVMGRRDAAMDRLRVSEDLFAKSAEVRRSEYRKLAALLLSAGSDTADILRMLSSPDTRRREGRMLHSQRILGGIAESLVRISGVQMLLAEQRPEGCPAEVDGELSRCESMLLNEFREVTDAVRLPLERYRQYTAKSFSPANLERYQKAYRTSGEWFDSDNFMRDGEER